MSEVVPSPLNGHPIATVLGWGSALVSIALTVLAARNVVWTISQWSSYEGSEQTTALVMMGVYAGVAVASWAIAIVILRSRRG
jgi:hypothetical protein